MMAKKKTIPTEFSHLSKREARISSDSEWMKRSVIIAKHTSIWLAQMGQAYGKSITSLDEIPDEALEALSLQGFSALWLVGIWEKSSISRSIKRRMGNKHAEASAYAIKSYRVAEDLGGQLALDSLKKRAARFGLRIGADMVPNHTAIDSSWLIEHPDWYLGVVRKPIEQYSFTDENLSEDARQEIYLEDHYLDKSDAAVVFKRVDGNSKEIRYIFHGNDGQDTPWNDTAQLDFSNQQLRKKVVDELVRLANNFPVLRLDAAMLLVNQHIQRLWFPLKHQRDHIAARQNNQLTQTQFQEMILKEFWLEALERLAAEAPETLLLAEAYWQLETYFSHSLGMHRVYNVAFMRSLAAEENRGLRASIKATLLFEPQLLQKQANYLSNPDEEAAMVTFGKGEKYFGACTLLATMPGMPIFAHGQIEGYRERYAMDIIKPNLQESVDEKFLAEHQRRIAPLLHRRDLFNGVTHFRFFDLLDNQGNVLEDIYCFINGNGLEQALVAFNNSAELKKGRVRKFLPLNMNGDIRNGNILDCFQLKEGERLLYSEFPSGKRGQLAFDAMKDKGFELSLVPYEAKIVWKFEKKGA